MTEKHKIEYIGVLNICDDDDPYAKKCIGKSYNKKFIWLDYFSENFYFFRSIGKDINNEVDGLTYKNGKLNVTDPEYLVLEFLSTELPTTEKSAIIFNTKNLDRVFFDWRYKWNDDKCSYEINLQLSRDRNDLLVSLISSFTLDTGRNILDAFENLPDEKKLLLEMLNPNLLGSLKKSINKIDQEILEDEKRKLKYIGLAC